MNEIARVSQAPDGAHSTNAGFFDRIGRSLRIGICGDFGGGNSND